MQIRRGNCKSLIAVFSLIVASKALRAAFLPPGRASAAAVLPHSDLSSEIRVTRNKSGRREGKQGAGAPSPLKLGGRWLGACPTDRAGSDAT